MKNRIDKRAFIFGILILLLIFFILGITHLVIFNDTLYNIWLILNIPIGYFGIEYLKEFSDYLSDWL